MRTLFVCVLAAGLLAAQEPQPDFVATYDFVTVPVTARNLQGHVVYGLSPKDFELFDKGVPQKVTEDDVSHPISMVVVVQASANMEKLLPGIRKVGNLMDQFVLGDDGELAVLAFDHRVQTITGFTSDPEQISTAFKKLKPGGGTSHLNDAALTAVRMLSTRAIVRRRILVLIAENRDYGSEATVHDVLTEAGFANVVIYPVEVSRLLASLTTQPDFPRPNPIPPEARQLPGGVIGTLTTEAQGQMGDIIPALKSSLKSDPIAVYAKMTGGREYSYMTQKALERNIADLGQEIHGQYLLTYLPSNRDQPGTHDIEVRISKPDLVVRTRASYAIAPGRTN